MDISFYQNKKVAILGLSTEGNDATKFFVSAQAKVTCCDRRSREDLGELYTILASYPVTFQLGKDYLQNLADFDLVIRTPGMALFLPELVDAKNKGVNVSSLTKVFFDLCPCPIIGVTGTKGKGTTSTLISEMLRNSGKKVYLGGNVGNPLLSKVRDIKPNDWVVLELSSFQLEDLHKSPHISVVLKTTQEHLANFDPNATNYHQSREHYVNAKKSIVKYQKNTDVGIFNDDNPTSVEFAKLTQGKKLFFSRTKDTANAFVKDDTVYFRNNGKLQKICNAKEIKLRGGHNLENIAAATLAAYTAGASLVAIQKISREFPGLEHRLELAGTVDGVSYYDDSFSTTPETTIAALQSFKEPIVLIAGGSEKGSDFTELGKEIIQTNLRALILVGQMTERIDQAVRQAVQSLQKPLPKIIKGCQNMKEIIGAARNEAKAGDVVLLSPACASFGMFKNYKDRGNQFKYYVRSLT